MMKLYTYLLNSYSDNEYDLQVRLASSMTMWTNFPVYPHVSIASSIKVCKKLRNFHLKKKNPSPQKNPKPNQPTNPKPTNPKTTKSHINTVRDQRQHWYSLTWTVGSLAEKHLLLDIKLNVGSDAPLPCWRLAVYQVAWAR